MTRGPEDKATQVCPAGVSRCGEKRDDEEGQASTATRCRKKVKYPGT